ncbi:DUF418 domain-containing protein [Microlunatus sp. GCM10028923]|uniref:DUF418 domain-containing protein n=1 Tax=Microlunatus sp. GCM10028923 TaxID=3273400 RepID=UPI003608E6DB
MDGSAPARRIVAPDLARGLMLLLIALANVSWYLYGAPTSGLSAHRDGTSGLEALWQSIAITVIDARSYPLFAFLFGYGIWQLYTRQQRSGQDERAARRLLQRRHLWMIGFGAVHAALLWYADVLGAYGLIGLIFVGLFLRRRDRTLIIWIGVLGGILALLAIAALAAGMIMPRGAAALELAGPQPAAITPYLDSVLPRLQLWLPVTLGQGVLGLVVPLAVLIAVLCARHRILESPAAHRRLLTRVMVAGIMIGWAGATPSVLVHHGVLDLPPWSPMLLHGFTGLFAALGYAAGFALIAARITPTRLAGLAVGALTALGRRSLSGYLLQSVIFAPLLSAWGLGLGGWLTQWQAALIAIITWLLSLALAVALERTGVRGPAEWLLRRLVYRTKITTGSGPPDRQPQETAVHPS